MTGRTRNDPDAKITKMKDGSTHLAHKAEHAVDMDSGAVLAVTLQGADLGDTTTIIETIVAATENLRAVADDARTEEKLDENWMSEVVADKGYHCNGSMTDLEEMNIRSYVSEPDRGRRDWSRQGPGAAGGVRQPAENPRRPRQTADAQTRRTGRTLLRPQL